MLEDIENDARYREENVLNREQPSVSKILGLLFDKFSKNDFLVHTDLIDNTAAGIDSSWVTTILDCVF